METITSLLIDSPHKVAASFATPWCNNSLEIACSP